MLKPTVSNLSHETARTTAHLTEHKRLLQAFTDGVYCLTRHLDVAYDWKRQDSTAILLVPKQACMFPSFASVDNDENCSQALIKDVSALFVETREIAIETIEWSKGFVYDEPMPESMRPHLGEKTKMCTDYFDRYRQSLHDREKLAVVCDNILAFTQLATRYGFTIQDV